MGDGRHPDIRQRATTFGMGPTSYSTVTELGTPINGENGANTLNGRSRADIFDFNAVADSLSGLADVISNFKHGMHKIDLTDIDTNVVALLDQAFVFEGDNADTVTNSVTWLASAGNTILNTNTTGDTTADMQMILTGVGLGLTTADFMLCANAESCGSLAFCICLVYVNATNNWSASCFCRRARFLEPYSWCRARIQTGMKVGANIENTYVLTILDGPN